MVVYPLTFIGFIINSILYRTNYPSIQYIVVKNLLFFIYTLIAVLFVLEAIVPIYAWWQILA